MYKRLPTTRELSQLLKPEKKLDTVAKFNKILSIIMICGITIVALAWFLIEWNLASKKITGYVAISSIGIVFVTWIISIIIDAIQSIGMFSNPDRELADQLDDGMDVERELVASFRAIPLHILLARHNRLEQQLLVWEKWLDVARLIGLLGPPLVLIGKEYLGTIGTLRIESLMAATFVGMLLGAIFIRSGMRRLQRVSYLLKRASERSSFRPNNRERRKRR